MQSKWFLKCNDTDDNFVHSLNVGSSISSRENDGRRSRADQTRSGLDQINIITYPPRFEPAPLGEESIALPTELKDNPKLWQ